jgi:hypothetical protein
VVGAKTCGSHFDTTKLCSMRLSPDMTVRNYDCHHPRVSGPSSVGVSRAKPKLDSRLWVMATLVKLDRTNLIRGINRIDSDVSCYCGVLQHTLS